VSGPITSSGNLLDNVHKAVQAGDVLLHSGFAPYVPHLNCLWEMITGARSYELWLQLDIDFLDVCDVLLRLPGASKGADREVERACERGIPVYHSLDALIADFPAEREAA
jgi:hypothetical protein